MNSYQIVQQIRYLLTSRKWEGNAAYQAVFHPNSVVETAATPDVALTELVMPAALIRPLDAEADAFDPRLMLERFEVTIVCPVAGGRFGRESSVGGPRAGGQGSSSGRGILELEAEVLATLQKRDQADGIRLNLRSKTASEPQLLENRWVTTRTYTFEAACTTDRYYHPPLRLAATALGGGVARLTWLNAPDRWDRRAVRIAYSAGATAPATYAAGTAVAIATAHPTTVDVTTGAGTFSFAAFEAYTETGAASDERYSSQERGTTKTLVVT